jgi:VIT1/CCC1 family predicted Fe2+/Mn2+ transporter
MGKRVLDPIDRVSEILFGLIMALTFTLSLSAGESGRADVRMMLTGAIGCNLAWGLVDAVMYLMSSLIERSRTLLTLRSMQQTADPRTAERIIAEALPPAVAEALGPAQMSALREHLANRPGPPSRAGLGKDDWLGAAAVFILVFVSTFPLAIPFIFIHDVMTALRVSNGIAIVLLFWCGSTLARYAGRTPWQTGLAMVLLGVVLVGITMALGG